jgi:3-hydroxybutyryl-CoA dehydrogenase
MYIQDIHTVAVIGAGTMGHGISQVLAGSDYNVIMMDIKQAAVSDGLRRIENSLKRLIDKDKISREQSQSVLSKISTTIDLKKITEADFIIESVNEDMDLKKEIFKEVSLMSKKKTVFATNTSTLSITEIASSTDRPERFIGMHFFNPVPLMKPVEVIKGVLTSEATVKLAINLVKEIGKIPISVKDSPGFASTRLGVALFVEASRMLEEGVASVKDIDTGAKLFYGHKMGPFETCDIIGLDARLNNMLSMHLATGDPKWSPPLLLKQLVSAGYLGNKPNSKGGYYTYFGIDYD